MQERLNNLESGERASSAGDLLPRGSNRFGLKEIAILHGVGLVGLGLAFAVGEALLPYNAWALKSILIGTGLALGWATGMTINYGTRWFTGK